MKYDIIIIGGGNQDAILGISALEAGKKCALICEGRISEDKSREEFRKKGGTLLMGDKVKSVKWNADGSVQAIYTENLEDTPLQAENYVLCSGRFFTRGLISDMKIIWEPVFDIDLKYDKDRAIWCNPDFFENQPFEQYGAIPSHEWRAIKTGKIIANLYIAGEILCDGQNNIEELCRLFKNA